MMSAVDDDPTGLERHRAAARVAAAERQIDAQFAATPDSEASASSGSKSESPAPPQQPQPRVQTQMASSGYGPAESAAERAFVLDLATLEPTSLSSSQKRIICNVIACCLPRPAPVYPRVQQGSNSVVGSPSANSEAAAQLGMGPSGDSDCPVPTVWELQFLLLLLQYFSLDSLTLVALQPLLGSGVDPAPFLAELSWASLEQRARFVLLVLHFSVVALGGYDARVRALLRTLCRPDLLNLSWAFYTRQENSYASLLAAQAAAARLEGHDRAKDSGNKRAMKYLKVGAASTVAGALLFVTGGLAAPAIGAGLASLGIGGAIAGGGVFLASSAGILLVASLFGATGAGLIGYKLNRRISSLQEFRFERLSGVAAGAKVVSSPDQHQCLSVQLCINGWIHDVNDYHRVWAPLVPGRVICASLGPGEEEVPSVGPRVNALSRDSSAQVGQTGLTAGQWLRKEHADMMQLHSDVSARSADGADAKEAEHRSRTSIDDSKEARHKHGLLTRSARVGQADMADPSYTPGLAEHSEVYTLRWESDCLLRFGNGLQLITGQDIAKSVASAGLQQTVLRGLVLAVAWPVTLLQLGDIVDHPWLVVLNRCAQAGIELANALEARVAGRRPVTLVAYSMGARVVFLALEELARRKRRRARARAEAAAAQGGAKAASERKDPSLLDRIKSKSSSSSNTPNPNAAGAGKAAAGDKGKSKGSASSSSSSGGVDPSVEDADGVVLDVFLFGAPVPADAHRWRRAKSMVAGRLVNGYSKRDWALRYIYPLTSASLQVAGLMPITDKKYRTAQAARAAVAAQQRLDAEAASAANVSGPEQSSADQMASPHVPFRPSLSVDIPGDSPTADASPPAAATSLSSFVHPPIPPTASFANGPAAAGVSAPVPAAVAEIDALPADDHLDSPRDGEGEGEAVEITPDADDNDDDSGEEESPQPGDTDPSATELTEPAGASSSRPAAAVPASVTAASTASASTSTAGSDVPSAQDSSRPAPSLHRQVSSRTAKCTNYYGIESFDCTPFIDG